MIQAVDVSKVFYVPHPLQALNQVSLRVQRGEVVEDGHQGEL